MTSKQKASLVLDILIAVMVFYAWACMIFQWGDNGTISAGGFRNLRYFTVLSNLLMASACLIISDTGIISIKDTLLGVLPMLIYGIGYIGNILINGFGDAPYSNDWYGFLYWGWLAGLMIFALLILVTWVMALILRVVHNKIQKRS